MQHQGSCHCKNLTFEFDCHPDVTVYRCNCSICEMVGYQHLIVPADQFQLLSGNPAVYSFNSGVAKHTFCSVCGVKPFYTPRSNPEGVSVNYRCVDTTTFGEVEISDFDGQNWEANASSLSHLA